MANNTTPQFLKKPAKSEYEKSKTLLTYFHKQLISALSDEGADFILIGGHAALLYGSNRTKGDMDLLVKPDKEN
jgi:hypothetical protein